MNKSIKFIDNEECLIKRFQINILEDSILGKTIAISYLNIARFETTNENSVFTR